MHRCTFGAPAKKWYQTENGLWASRDWFPNEKAQYEREILGR